MGASISEFEWRAAREYLHFLGVEFNYVWICFFLATLELHVSYGDEHMVRASETGVIAGASCVL